MLDIPGYRVLSTVRVTSSSTLFHAVREADAVPVILKTPTVSVPSLGDTERCRREFTILCRLQDVPGVVKPFAYERIQERPVLFLEWVHGQPLSESTGQPLAPPRFLDLALSLVSILAEVHRHDVIHKDIKPSNIILGPSDEVRLIDFGVASLQRVEHVDAAPVHLVEGTLAYMSPEQTGRMNRVVDYRTDFYSLGVTFYELLTGRVPFQAQDALGWFHAHMAQSPRPPHELEPTVPRAVSAVVMKLLAKVAEARYQSAEGLRADLERCREVLARDPHEVFPLGTFDRAHRFQLPQRLYGRDTHLASLYASFECVARTGRPELLLLSGYSGIGKSSVVHELYKPVVERRGLFLSGKFDQFQRDLPYATLAQTLGALVRQLLAKSEEELGPWRASLLRAWSGQGQRLVELVPSLEVLVGPQPVPAELSTSEAQHYLFRVLGQFLASLATPEHPMVVFLDDLQWADLSSLQLLEWMLSRPEAPPVLWLGAYRDNEVGPAHPLLHVLEVVRAAGTRLTDLRLEPLSAEQVEHLVGDTLPGAGPEVVTPLAALVREKTGGNPFFLLKLLVVLHQDSLLTRSPEGGWRWDAEGIRQRDYSENVVTFLVGAIRQLPPDTQHLLRLAACAGSVFHLQLLGTLAGLSEEKQVEQGLELALREGLVTRTGPETYRFLHDRIQQAAHELSSPAEREQVHLRIGRLLLARLSPEELQESLFAVVSQLNAGAALMEAPQERHQLARLNAEAGKKARASIALRPAVGYFSTAFTLIPGDPWETDFALAFQVLLAQTRLELVIGHFAEADRLIASFRSRARNRAERVEVTILYADIQLHVFKIMNSLEGLRECLALMDMPISRQPTWEEAVAAHEEAWAALGERPIASLIELPPLVDPELKQIIHTMVRLLGVAYTTDHHLFIILMSRVVSLTVRHGFTGPAAQGLTWFGCVTGWYFRRYTEGFAFAQLGREFVERHHLNDQRGWVLSSMSFSSYWVQPIARVQEQLFHGLGHAIQSNEAVPAAFCNLFILINRLAMGHSLDEVHQESLDRIPFLHQTGFLEFEQIALTLQRFVQQMRGLTPSFHSLQGEEFDAQALEVAASSPERMNFTRFLYWALKVQSCFLCGDLEGARVAGDAMLAHRWGNGGLLLLREGLFYRALTLAACAEQAPAEQRREWLEAIEQHRQELAAWAELCPENFRALERLVFAEQARLGERVDEAARAYEAALRAARESGATHFRGLAGELAANFWRTREAPLVALGFAREARAAYLQWGARGKCQQLDSQWPELASDSPPVHPRGTTSTRSTQLDALTVVKAQQAVSGEIVLERLVEALMRAALENAGAQRGALLLAEGERLVVATLVHVSPEGYLVTSEDKAHAPLPWTLLHYVRRLREHVLIGDTSLPHPFAADEYLARGGARSVLCLPLLRREQWTGALYLENNLATNAFSPERLSLLEHLASQAAISIENARLYEDVRSAKQALRQANDELERRVEERTRELKQAQARLVDTAREVGMAEIASNVLHNVGNVLTSAVINLEMMRRAVGSLRVGRLKQAAALLVDNRAALGDFLTTNPRGIRLPDYFVALGEEMMKEQTRLMDEMDVMNRHIEHIRAIVQVQQTYAGNSLMTEECEMGGLIEDALRIQMAGLRRHGVNVHRELKPVPRVTVDKHKVLQILINLLSNAKQALDAAPEGNRNLTVRLSAHGGMVRIQVADNGAGIAPEMMSRLFAHGFTTRKDGHGFGLHASALAAQMMKGHLSLESAGPGQGAVATLELPLT